MSPSGVGKLQHSPENQLQRTYLLFTTPRLSFLLFQEWLVIFTTVPSLCWWHDAVCVFWSLIKIFKLVSGYSQMSMQSMWSENTPRINFLLGLSMFSEEWLWWLKHLSLILSSLFLNWQNHHCLGSLAGFPFEILTVFFLFRLFLVWKAALENTGILVQWRRWTFFSTWSLPILNTQYCNPSLEFWCTRSSQLGNSLGIFFSPACIEIWCSQWAVWWMLVVNHKVKWHVRSWAVRSCCVCVVSLIHAPVFFK